MLITHKIYLYNLKLQVWPCWQEPKYKFKKHTFFFFAPPTCPARILHEKSCKPKIVWALSIRLVLGQWHSFCSQIRLRDFPWGSFQYYLHTEAMFIFLVWVPRIYALCEYPGSILPHLTLSWTLFANVSNVKAVW